ncbi:MULTISPECIES: KAP family P-loop NTPase fold protein [Pseudomonas]|jgi:predicted KAP-like P-loop ATPase|uniref:NTPase KAP n=1 Tax=Pseudomonas granadensis TaxID=1421430 RepID=A0ABX7G9T4_9PSED|nr:MULTISPECIES: P-loop NTPase fold protein [Pseudomonas]MBD8597662.1 NTPase KAP [Pseudomonas sp. CFBP 8772]QRK81888.1 NTPase KAP [Pseudomonas granadensis]
MWHDNETTTDYLNFGVVADACASLLKQSAGEPISIGVSGGWGAGKSSLVKMIASRLADLPTGAATPPTATQSDPAATTQNTRYVVITFNPWLYQDFESARSALLQIVGDEVLKLAKGDQTLWNKAVDLMRRINLLKLVQVSTEAALTIKTGLPIGSVGKAVVKAMGWFKSSTGDAGEDQAAGAKSGDAEGSDDEGAADYFGLKSLGILNPANPMSLPNEIQAFRDALEQLLGELGVTLVVFVDDLDRCLPETAISTLESIRLLLFLKRTAFVIAADNDFIRGAVKKHFEGTDINDDIATNYFDKLIQVPLHVPRLGVNEAKAYLVLLLLEREARAGAFAQDKFENAKRLIPKRLSQSWQGETITSQFLFELVDGDLRLQELMQLAEGLAPLMFNSTAISANPRLMKRFLNTVFLRQSLAAPQGIKLDVPALAKWHLLERCNEDLAKTLSSLVTSDNDGEVSILLEAESLAASGAGLPDNFPDEFFVREWLQLAPALGARDLRPLLHLSRDSATRDFGDDNMTPASRQLRDMLKKASSGNDPLTQAIRALDTTQAELAMVKAWQGTVTSRSWKNKTEMVMLIEPCKVHTSLGKRAAVLLAQAPAKSVGPGIIPSLANQSWATDVLKSWKEHSEIAGNTKKAIDLALRNAS